MISFTAGQMICWRLRHAHPDRIGLIARRTSTQGDVYGNLTSLISGDPIRFSGDVSSCRRYIFLVLVYAGNR
jgi:hypothetical protein